MPTLKRAVVQRCETARPGLIRAVVRVDGGDAAAIAYEELTGPLAPGDAVIVNTTAVDLGLGSGGVHFVVAVEGREAGEPPAGHAMKLRYSPHQTAVGSIEDDAPAALDEGADLGGTPVVALGLHSALVPAAIGVRARFPAARIAYVMTDQGALAMAFSDTVAAARAAGLLDATITTGQAFGGELEAVNVFSGLAAARSAAAADVILAGMGPGNLGTASVLGFASIEAGVIVNAAAALAGVPVVVPRISFADTRDRHHGLSHHTVTTLGVAALARAHVAVPDLPAEEAALVEQRLAPLRARHEVVTVALGDVEALLAASPIPLRSMGRSFAEDPHFFRAAAAAGVRAASLAGASV